jgi:hypothetical protein
MHSSWRIRFSHYLGALVGLRKIFERIGKSEGNSARAARAEIGRIYLGQFSPFYIHSFDPPLPFWIVYSAAEFKDPLVKRSSGQAAKRFEVEIGTQKYAN